MKVGVESICYQYHQAETILKKLLIDPECKKIKFRLLEAIEWITDANDSAVRMENKLKEYKENDRTREERVTVI